MPKKLTAGIIAAAIEGFEQQKLRIDAQIAELRTMLPGAGIEPAATPEVAKGKRRRMSAAARKRIGDAQRKRWAESKEASQPAVTSEAPQRKKRELSAAGRRAIAEATKKRWAAFHAAKAAKKPPLKKKGTAKKVTRKVAKKAPPIVAKKLGVKRPQKKATNAPAITTEVTTQ